MGGEGPRGGHGTGRRVTHGWHTGGTHRWHTRVAHAWHARTQVGIVRHVRGRAGDPLAGLGGPEDPLVGGRALNVCHKEQPCDRDRDRGRGRQGGGSGGLGEGPRLPWGGGFPPGPGPHPRTEVAVGGHGDERGVLVLLPPRFEGAGVEAQQVQGALVELLHAQGPCGGPGGTAGTPWGPSRDPRAPGSSDRADPWAGTPPQVKGEGRWGHRGLQGALVEEGPPPPPSPG